MRDALWARARAELIRPAVPEIERLGYRVIWLPEGRKDVFVNAGVILAAGRRIVVGTAVANPWIRAPYLMATAARTLGEAFPDRFILGLGMKRTLSSMRSYLDAMDRAPYGGPVPRKPVQRLLAGALGPEMLALAAERSRGALTYFSPVAHTAFARASLGPGPVLAVEQCYVLDLPRREALERAREYAARYLRFPSGLHLRRLGFGTRELTGSGSDRLLKAIVAIGGADAIADRVRGHLEAGADHVCVRPLVRGSRFPVENLARIAAALSVHDGG